MGDASPAVPQFTDARRTRPAWLRPINGLGRVLPQVARPSAEAWMSAAAERAGVEVTFDAEVVEALSVLVDSLNA